eukprot:31137-Pelagococcus_subviridis.AAC.6
MYSASRLLLPPLLLPPILLPPIRLLLLLLRIIILHPRANERAKLRRILAPAARVGRLRLPRHPRASEPFHPPGVRPRPLAVPRPAAPAAPGEARDPQRHVNREVRDPERERERAGDDGGDEQEKLEDRSDASVVQPSDEPRREVLPVRATLALPLRVRLRARVVDVDLRRVQVVRRSPRRVAQGGVRARGHAHGVRRGRVRALVGVYDARELVVRSLDVRVRAVGGVQLVEAQDLVVVVLTLCRGGDGGGGGVSATSDVRRRVGISFDEATFRSIEVTDDVR